MAWSLYHLSPEAMETLLRYDWPGNVRELKGAIDSGVTLATGNQITVRDLPLTMRGASGALAPREGATQKIPYK